MKRQCVRCWVRLDNDRRLWCSRCMARVNEELEWKADREYEYYFRYHLKRMRKEREKEMLK
jgi:hypothetical protein